MIKKQLLLFVMMLLPMVASAHDIEVQNGDGVTIYYNYINDGTELAVSYRGVSASHYSNEYTGNVVIPGEVTYNNVTYSVTNITNDAFSSCSGLTSVTIGNSVTSIGNSAFYGCSGLTSVTIGNSVTSIGEYAFRGCSGLTSVTIRNSVTSIGSNAFYECSSLNKVIVANIGTWCAIDFGNSYSNPLYYAHHLYSDENTEIKDLVIPNSVTSIGNSAFSGCSGLTSVTIGSGVTSIGKSAFENCSSLEKVIAPEIAAWCVIKFDSYDANPLYYAHHLYSDENTEIKDLVIPNSVTSIGEEAFYGCSGLTSVTIGNSVTTIGNYAFSGCKNITKISLDCKIIANYFEDSKTVIKEVILGDNVQTINSQAFCLYTNIASINIPNSVTSIGDYAFSGCSSLASVSIGMGLTSYTSNVFSSCKNITKISLDCKIIADYFKDSKTVIKEVLLGDNVQTINSKAFSGYTNIASINIPDGVKRIGSYAFENCSGLRSVSFGSGVTTVDENVFSGCTHLSSLSFNCKEIGDWFSDVKAVVKQITLGDNVELIDSKAFYLFTKLSSVDIPNGVKTIGNNAFSGCTNLNTVSISQSVNNIASNAFENCEYITTLSLDCKQTANWFASSKSKVRELVLGEHTEIIGPNSFSDFSNLMSLTIGNNVTTISNSAFSGCIGLASLVIPQNVTSIGGSAFRGCRNLISLDIPNSVTTIGSSAFCECGSLTSVKIPNSVKSISNYAFDACSSLISVKVSWERPLAISDYVFTGVDKSVCSLYVPKGTGSLYQAANGWKDFKNIQEEDKESIVHYITIRMGDGGTINELIESGKIYQYKVQADEGWTINTLTFNGNDMTSNLVDGLFTTPTITGDSELSVVFCQESSGIKTIERSFAQSLRVYVNGNTIRVDGAKDDSKVMVYNVNGMFINSYVGNCKVTLCSGQYIVKIDNQTFKVSL